MNATQSSSAVRCRFCGSDDSQPFVDLGMAPPCESFLTADQLDEVEHFYPLAVRVCPSCFLVQLRDYIPAEEIFTEYAYFSSYSDSWLAHARAYTTTLPTASKSSGSPSSSFGWTAETWFCGFKRPIAT